MGDCYITRRGSGSGGLNFNVIAYASELLLPATAKENTIAVITETPITGWSFAASTPASPYEGMVWFSTANVTVKSFNAVKKNELLVYPNKASQYVNGMWVEKIALHYQNGVWNSFFIQLYNAGNEYPDITGGISLFKFLGGDGPTASASKNATNITLTAYRPTDYGYHAGLFMYTVNKIDLRGFNTASAKFESFTSYGDVALSVFSAPPIDLNGTYRLAFVKTVSNAVDLDISNIDAGHICVYARTSSGAGTVTAKVSQVALKG